MSRLLMISLNDRGSLGARQIAAAAKERGHAVAHVLYGEYNHTRYEFSENEKSS